MRIAGYKKRAGIGDYLRKEGHDGRFHMKVCGKKTLHLHYDIFVDNGARHFTAEVPILLRGEMKRILKRLYHLQLQPMTREALDRKLQKHFV